MSYLLSTTNYLLAFDGCGEFRVVHSGQGLYYGLAAAGPAVYAGCRNRSELFHDPAAGDAEAGSIVVLDSATLEQVDEWRPESFNLRDIHGIFCGAGRLWVTCSRDNMVAVRDLRTGEWTRWYPAPDPSARGRDVHHFNTFQLNQDRIQLLAHNNGPSQILEFDLTTLDLIGVSCLGDQAHDLFTHDTSTATCSSGKGLLAATSGWTLRTGGFPRGIAFGTDRILVGISQIAERQARHQASGVVREFDAQWRFVSDFVLFDVGMILSILSIAIEDRTLKRLPLFPGVEHCVGRFNRVVREDAYLPGQPRCNAVYAAEWHAPEGSHRWTAARNARLEVAINPSEDSLSIRAYNGFPGDYSVRLFLDTEEIGCLRWDASGETTGSYPIPHGITGVRQLSFQVPQLWRPSLCYGSGDTRSLGISVSEVSLHRS